MIVKSADDLCSYYPNLNQCHLHLKDEDKFLSQEEIDRTDIEIIKMDSNVLKKTGIDENKKYNRDDLYKIVNNSLKKKKDLKDICWKRMYLD